MFLLDTNLRELALRGTLILIVLFNVMIAFSYSSADWTIGEYMPSKRLESSGAALGNKIYIIGGVDSKHGTTDLVEVYDIEIDEWSSAAPLPKKLDHIAATSYNGKIYVVGGFTNRGVSTNDLFIYNPTTNKWEEAANMPTARGALTANFVNGTLYAIGGDTDILYNSNGEYNPEGMVAINEAYNPNTNTWTKKSPMPTARHHFSSAVVDEKLYVIGGRQSEKSPSFSNVDANEMYDPEEDRWTKLEPMPSKRSGLASASLNGNIYVVGGETTEITFDNNEKYNPNTDSWTSESPMPTARHGLVSIAIGEKLYVIGGGLEAAGLGDNINEIFHAK